MLLLVIALAMLAVTTFYALPSASAAASLVAAACAVGLGAPGTPAACASTGVYLGALAFLLATGLRRMGAAQPSVMAAVVVLLLVASAIQAWPSDKKNVYVIA